jgi:hypothetical protein
MTSRMVSADTTNTEGAKIRQCRRLRQCFFPMRRIIILVTLAASTLGIMPTQGLAAGPFRSPMDNSVQVGGPPTATPAPPDTRVLPTATRGLGPTATPIRPATPFPTPTPIAQSPIRQTTITPSNRVPTATPFPPSPPSPPQHR